MAWMRNLRDAADILIRARNPAELVKALVPQPWLPRRVLNDTEPPAEPAGATELAERLRKLRNRLKAEVVGPEGQVDYARLRDSNTFAEIKSASAMLRSADLSVLDGDPARIAFWINIYNVLAIHGVVALGIRRSVMEIPSFFGTVAYDVGGFVVNLDEIENGILRRNAPHPATGAHLFRKGDPRLSLCPSRVDPRIHAALVCASHSCPPVAFYDAGQLEAQLDVASRGYVTADVVVDVPEHRVRLPITFRYYQADFGGTEGIWAFLVDHAEEAQAEALRSAKEAGFTFGYHRYDWSLNSIA